jgi:hypothetical protein
VQDPEAALGQRQVRVRGRRRAEHRARGGQGQRHVLPVQAGDHGLADGHEVAEQVPESFSPVRSVRIKISGAAGHGQNGLSLDGPPEALGVGTHALGAPEGRRADHAGPRGEAGQQVGQQQRVHRALGVQRAQLVLAGPVVPVARRGVPDQDQRHRGARRPQARDHVGVMGVAEPVQRLRQRQPGHRIDLVAGRGFVVSAACGPVVDLLGPAVDEVFDRAQPGAEHGPHAGLLEDLPDRGEQHVLAGLALALGQRPVVVSGPVHEQHLGPVSGGTPQHGTGRQDGLAHRWRLIGHALRLRSPAGRKPDSSAERARRSRTRVSWMSRKG